MRPAVVIIVIIFMAPLLVIPFCEIYPVTTLSDSVSFNIDDDKAYEKTMELQNSQFLENIGQVKNSDVLFYGSIPGGTIGFGASRVYLWMNGADSLVTLSFEDSNIVIPEGADECSHRTSYFLGDRGTFTDVQSFSQMIYEDLWFGIDLIYRASSEGAKYEFRVSPQASPSYIRIRVEGQDSLTITSDSLTITNEDGQFFDEGLLVFQGDLERKAQIVSLEDDIYGFQVFEYDRSKPLVIDPLIYSTYIGGINDDDARAIYVDTAGHAYVAGSTWSSDFPASSTHNATHIVGASDIFVVKLDTPGNNLPELCFWLY